MDWVQRRRERWIGLRGVDQDESCFEKKNRMNCVKRKRVEWIGFRGEEKDGMV